MRDGYNPLRRTPLAKPSDVVQAVITHLPNEEDYHEQRFDIVRLSLLSMRAHAGVEELPIYVFDNGSGEKLKEWLFYEFKPETIVLSPNIGKWSARASIFRAHRPDTVIGLADDDFYYYPDWLEPQMRVLMNYVGVGVVSGYPHTTAGRWGIGTTLKWAEEKEGVRLEEGKFIPDKWERQYAASIGRDPEEHLEQIKDDVNWRITHKEIQVYAMGHHAQFITVASLMFNLAAFSNQATSEERVFDEAIDKMGFLRLSTTERLTRHMGNILDADLQSEMDRLVHGKDIPAPVSAKSLAQKSKYKAKKTAAGNRKRKTKTKKELALQRSKARKVKP